jgi:hypothetical protein
VAAPADAKIAALSAAHPEAVTLQSVPRRVAIRRSSASTNMPRFEYQRFLSISRRYGMSFSTLGNFGRNAGIRAVGFFMLSTSLLLHKSSVPNDFNVALRSLREKDSLLVVSTAILDQKASIAAASQSAIGQTRPGKPIARLLGAPIDKVFLDNIH